MMRNSNKKAKSSSEVEFLIPTKFKFYLLPLGLIIVSTIISSIIIISSAKVAKGDKTEAVSVINNPLDTATPNKQGKVVGQLKSFTEYDNETCKKDGKPIVFMFSTTWCPHCNWIKDEFDKWAKEQKDVQVYHYDLDTGDNTLTDAVETAVPQEYLDIYETFNPSQTIPTYVFGCKYGRIGNTYEASGDLEKEIKEFDDVVEELLSPA